MLKSHRTVLLNPLTPFFVVFCNVVATSNLEDLQLLRKVTADLSRTKGKNPFLANLHKFLFQFINLCVGLDSAKIQDTSLHPELPNGVSRSMDTVIPHQEPHEEPITELGNPVSDQRQRVSAPTATQWGAQGLEPTVHSQPTPRPPIVPLTEAVVESRPEVTSIWDDDHMWDLFNTQPSVEWCDLDLSDAFVDSRWENR